MSNPPSFSSPYVSKADTDMNTLLCFTCSSSLPPLKKSSGSSTSASSPSVFTTPCCQRLICSRCITTNPRLQRYNPCLVCLGGVDVMRTNTSNPPLGPGACLNLNGAVRDEDTFVLGDDNSANEDEKDRDTALFLDTDTLTSTQNAPQNGAQGLRQEERPTESKTEEGMGSDISESFPSPLKYYILQSDTLQGIVLRFGLDGREVCRLNNLPSSTLRTTPHLLHTRRYLILPPSARKAGLPVRKEPPEEVAAREVKWRKERAEKRLQTLMKEADWYVAKAYVALADDPVEEIEEQEDWDKIKEYGDDVGPRPTNLEERAIRKYLDDDEWEATQRERASG